MKVLPGCPLVMGISLPLHPALSPVVFTIFMEREDECEASVTQPNWSDRSFL